MKCKTVIPKALNLACIIICVLFLTSCDKDLQNMNTVSFSVTLPDDQNAILGEEVLIIPTVVYTGNDDLVYEWKLNSKPNSSTYAITDSNLESIIFSENVLGAYEFSLAVTTSGGESKSDQIVISVVKEPVYLSGKVTESLTLVDIYSDPSCPDYVVSGTYTVQSDLKVEPGVIIEFEEDAGIYVVESGSMHAAGNLDKPIVFTGTQKIKGHWKGIRFDSNNPNNLLSYVNLEYGGKSGFDGANVKANLILKNSRVVIENSTISNGAHFGILIRSSTVNLEGFKENTITLNNCPIKANSHTFAYFDQASDYSGNTLDYIDSEHVSALLSNAVWKNLNVPYKLADNVILIDADLEIMEGTTLLGQPNCGLNILKEGALYAKGTASLPISFVGEEDIKGYWKGINIQSNKTRNVLDHVIISNGGEKGFDGANVKANLTVEDNGRIKILNSTFSKSSVSGIHIRDIPTIVDEFKNNRITDNGVPVTCKMNHFHFFDLGSDLTGNIDDAIATTGANSATTVNGAWVHTSVPFKLVRLEFIGSEIMIGKGVEIIGLDNAGIEVKVNGTITVNGTTSEPVIFRGDEDVQGYWRGIRVESSSTKNVINNAIVSNGGSSGFTSTDRISDIQITGILEVNNSVIKNSLGYGVRVENGGVFVESNNTYSNNFLGDVYFE